MFRRKTLSGPDAAPAYTPQLAARSIDGHLVRTATGVYAWYRLALHRWAYGSDSLRTQLMHAIAGQYAELQGRWLHLRVTSRPFPIQDWATNHAANTRDQLPDTPGALSFDDYLAGEQQHLYGRSMTDKEVFLGVEVHTRTAMDRAIDRSAPLLRKIFPTAVDAELTALDAEITHIDSAVAGFGLAARPATAAEMQWLMYRSATLGLPAPHTLPPAVDRWEPEDMASFADAAQMYTTPYAPTVTVHGTSGAVTGMKRQVAVLTLGQLQPLTIPESDTPWSAVADALTATGPDGHTVAVPVEQSGRIYVQRPEEVSGRLQRQATKVRSQERHYADEHGLDPPRTLASQSDRVLEIDQEMSEGFTALATRMRWWWRFAVADMHAGGEEETLTYAHALLERYKPKIGIEHPEAQYKLAREFIPGEPLSSSAYVRQTEVRMFAAGMPQTTTNIGDRRGVLLGDTVTGTRRPVAWDPWMAQEIRDGSGLTAMCAGLGAGKSFLGGGLVYKTLRSGARWTLLDPSGPLAALCELPELHDYARPINLLNAEPGILNPYRVVPEPSQADFADDDDPERACMREKTLAAATRRNLVQEVFTGLLPYEIASMPATRITLLRAVRATGGGPDTSPATVIEHLRRNHTEHHDHAMMVADFLDEMRERLTLLLPEDPEQDPYAHQRDDRLTVLTLAGLTLPKDGVSREHWNDAEIVGVQLLSLAAWLTQRSIYERPKDERKGIWIDEAFFLSDIPSGRALMNRFARDSRKWNVRCLLSSQIPGDFLRMKGFTSLVDSVFVGYLDDAEDQTDALRLLKIPENAGYEQTIGTLRRSIGMGTDSAERDTEPRRFLFADGVNGAEKIRVDFGGDHLAHLRTVLDTTPGQPGSPHQEWAQEWATAARATRALREVVEPEHSDGDELGAA